jgi:hypothetical protein
LSSCISTTTTSSLAKSPVRAQGCRRTGTGAGVGTGRAHALTTAPLHSGRYVPSVHATVHRVIRPTSTSAVADAAMRSRLHASAWTHTRACMRMRACGCVHACVRADMHLRKIAPRHLGVKFLYLNSEKAPFFVQKARACAHTRARTIPSACCTARLRPRNILAASSMPRAMRAVACTVGRECCATTRARRASARVCVRGACTRGRLCALVCVCVHGRVRACACVHACVCVQLAVRVLPTIVCFIDGKAMDRIVGFSEFGAQRSMMHRRAACDSTVQRHAATP